MSSDVARFEAALDAGVWLTAFERLAEEAVSDGRPALAAGWWRRLVAEEVATREPRFA